MGHLCQVGLLAELTAKCISFVSQTKTVRYGHKMPSLMSPYPFLRHDHSKPLELQTAFSYLFGE
jgi:hypothetical protein